MFPCCSSVFQSKIYPWSPLTAFTSYLRSPEAGSASATDTLQDQYPTASAFTLYVPPGFTNSLSRLSSKLLRYSVAMSPIALASRVEISRLKEVAPYLTLATVHKVCDNARSAFRRTSLNRICSSSTEFGEAGGSALYSGILPMNGFISMYTHIIFLMFTSDKLGILLYDKNVFSYFLASIQHEFHFVNLSSAYETDINRLIGICFSSFALAQSLTYTFYQSMPLRNLAQRNLIFNIIQARDF